MWLSLADRLYQLPLGLVGIAIGIVLLPDLSRRLQAGDTAGGAQQINRAREFALLLTLPATVALIVIATPLVSVLFGRGAFGAGDVAATALAVAVYGAGLPAFVLQKVYAPVFFAREDTKTPFRYALAAMVVNAALAIGLSPFLGYLAAALGTTVSAWAMLYLLIRGAARIEGAVVRDPALERRLWRIAAASLLMGAALSLAAAPLAPALAEPGWRYLALAGLVGGGAAVYASAALALRAVDLASLRRALRRGA